MRFASGWYSVPTRPICSTVRLQRQGGRLLIADQDGEVVADHALAAPGEASVLDGPLLRPEAANLALVGPPGTGKSHTPALGHAAVIAGHRVK